MKRFIKIMGVLFAVICLIGVAVIIGGYFFLRNLDVKKYKPQIIQAAGRALGRPVNFADIGLTVSLKDGIRFHLSDFLIAEDPDFGTESFASVDSIDARIDIRAYFAFRQISASGIFIRTARINLIRNAGGMLNIQTIGFLTREPSEKEQAPLSPVSALPAIFIDSLKVENARINWIDRSVQPESKVAVTQTALEVRQFSLLNPFDVSFETALGSDAKNFRFSGKLQLKPLDKEAKLTDARVSVDLGRLPLRELKRLPEAAGLVIPQALEGQMAIGIKQAVISDKGLGELFMEAALTGGKVVVQKIAPRISLEVSQLDFKLENFSLDGQTPARVALRAAAFQNKRNIDLSGLIFFDIKTLEARLTEGVFTTDLALWPLDTIRKSASLLEGAMLPEQLSGKLDAAVKEISVSPDGVTAALIDLQVSNGALVFNDIAPGVSLALDQTDLTVKGFSLAGPATVILKAAYLSGKQNVHIHGLVEIQPEDQQIVFKDVIAQADLSTLDMGLLKKSVAALKDVSLPEQLKGGLRVVVGQGAAGPQGLKMLLAKGSLKDAEVKFKELTLPAHAPKIDFSMTENRLIVDPFRASLGQGEIKAGVTVSDYLSNQILDLSAEMKNIRLEEILDQAEAPVKAFGAVFGDIKAKGQMTNLPLLTASGSFEVSEAKLKDFNALKTVLSKVSFLPDFASRVEARLPEKYKQKLKSKDTEIKTIKAAYTLSDMMARLDPISIETDEFVFSGTCRASLDQKYTLDGKVKIAADLSAAMAQSVDELKYMYDEEGAIGLPVHISGHGPRVPTVAVTQTVIDMGENAIRNQGIKELEKVLDKVFKMDTPPAASPSGKAQQPDNVPTEQKPSGAQVIEGILEQIFK